MSCICGESKSVQEKKSVHLGLYCAGCGKWIKWIPQEKNDPEKKMPFGKYKGISLVEILRKDPGYIKWLASIEAGNFTFTAQSMVEGVK